MQHNEQEEVKKVYLLGSNSRHLLEPNEYISNALELSEDQQVFNTPTEAFQGARGDYGLYRGILELAVPIAMIQQVNGKNLLIGHIRSEWVTGILILSNQNLLKDKTEIETKKNKTKYLATIFGDSKQPWAYHKMPETDNVENDEFYLLKSNAKEVFYLIESILQAKDFWQKQAKGSDLPNGIKQMMEVLKSDDSLEDKLATLQKLARNKETKGKQLFGFHAITRGGVTRNFYSAVAALDIAKLEKINQKIDEDKSPRLSAKPKSSSY